jgi:hypothetical protein
VTLERLSVDDAAQAADELFRERALELHRAAAAGGGQAAQPGVCSNCAEPCLPTAVYCDPECRSDHERRQRIHARMRVPLG